MPRFVEFHYRTGKKCCAINPELVAAIGHDMTAGAAGGAWIQVAGTGSDENLIDVAESYEEVKAKLEIA